MKSPYSLATRVRNIRKELANLHALDRYKLCMRSLDPSSEEGQCKYELDLLRKEINQIFQEAHNT